MRQIKKECVYNFQKRPSLSEVQISHFVQNDKASACFRGQGANRLPVCTLTSFMKKASVNPTIGGFFSGQGAF
jgi:hypothetical protein